MGGEAILMSLIVMTLISLGLGICLMLADKYLADLGEFDITVNGDKVIRGKGGMPLLFALANEKIFIPSACGGKGSCGVCKIQVDSGAGEIIATEKAYLTKKEMKENVRLSCQVKLRKDCSIHVPEELLSVSKFETLIESIVDVTYDIKEITFKLIEPNTVHFKPGQFMQLNVPDEHIPSHISDPVYRAYSVQSKPSQTDRIQLLIRLVPGGVCTNYVFHHLKEGDTAYLTGPFGDFTLHEEAPREMICVAGGSGMAPLRCILDTIFERVDAGENWTRPVKFYFGARAIRDLFYINYFREKEKKYPFFKFIPALSHPLQTDKWSGEFGLITEVIDRLETDCTQKETYQCGSPLMIDAVVKLLTEKKGMPEGHIYYDKFS